MVGFLDRLSDASPLALLRGLSSKLLEVDYGNLS